jgi:hypothetical protein
MKKFLPALLLVLLTACTVKSYRSEQSPPASNIDAPEVSFSSSEASSVAKEWKSIVLVDQDYNVSAKGAEWLKAIGTQLVTGNASEARLVIDLSRGNDDKGWSAIGMYAAPQRTFTNNDQSATFRSPDESVYGTNLMFISAAWRGSKGADGKCQRSLAPSSSFGVLNEHSNSITVDLNAVPVTAKDACDTSTRTLDLLSALNDGGVYLGFMPSNAGYHAKVTLEYVGDLSAKPF